MNTDNFYRESHTPVMIPPCPFTLKPGDALFSAGSCFAEKIRRKWKNYFLPGAGLPSGNTYNPLSLLKGFEVMLTGNVKPNNYLQSGEFWYHFGFDHATRARTREELENSIISKITASKRAFQQSHCILLTLGTAYIYEDSKTHRCVNNCHKLPGNRFNRRLLEPEEISNAIEKLIHCIHECNPAVKIVLTLSPVRHLRDKPEENSLSKGILRWGIDRAIRNTGNKAWYFPSFEILLDELRDYRWYGADLCHPSERATEYIMQQFFQASASAELLKYLNEAGKIRRMLDHTPIDPETADFHRFLEQRNKKAGKFKEKYPFARLPFPE